MLNFWLGATSIQQLKYSNDHKSDGYQTAFTHMLHSIQIGKRQSTANISYRIWEFPERESNIELSTDIYSSSYDHNLYTIVVSVA